MADKIKAINEEKTLKEHIQAEREKSALRDKEERLMLAMQTRVLNRNAKYEDTTAAADKQWNKLFSTVENLKGEWGRGYNNDWVTSTYAMLLILEEFHYALHASKPLSRLLGVVLDPLSDIAVNFFNERTYSLPPKKALPKLLFHTEFTDDNQLTVASLAEMRRTDGQPMFPKQIDPKLQESQDNLQARLEEQLQNCVKRWLGDLGYESKGDGRFTDKVTKKELTKDLFERLRDNKDEPSQSFAAVLKGKFDMDFELDLKPRPRP